MRYVGALLLVCLSCGCVTEAHRRVLEGTKIRAVRLAEFCATDETVPAERKQDAVEIVQGCVALQKQAVPKPTTVVVGTTEEFQKDLADADSFDTTYLKVKQLAKGAWDWALGNWGWLAGVGGAFGVISGLAKKLMSKNKVINAGIQLFSKTKEVISGEGKALDKFKTMMTEAKADGPTLVDGAKELYEHYVKLKSAGQA